ncbi:MAG: NAD-dependent epimerase/dehydratase family protein [Acidobacteriia bacterium]|nr:NAD-dependent epimerase/dehydratase family protein [Terriglobia bacterium]
MSSAKRKILVTGSSGQIGSELVPALRERYGTQNVVACDIKPLQEGSGPFELADVTDREALEGIIRKHRIGSIYHLVSILSAAGEMNPNLAWSVNIESLRNVLDLALQHKMEQVFWPSSIAAFGPHTPRIHTHQLTVMDPNTMYGITKVTGELLCNYYFVKYGLDVRCLRYPGIISWKTPPGGGTTDYAVAIFHGALREGRYECFVAADTVIPMMYMPDAIRAAIEFTSAPRSRLHTHLGYNLAAMSFSARELAKEVKRHLPGFVCTYKPDARQKIADSWPKSIIDDRCSRKDWGWKPRFNLCRTVEDMLNHLRVVVPGPR